MEKSGMKKKEISMEEFRELAKDMKPVLKSMETVLKKHNINCLTSMTVSTDGYFNFNVHDSEWVYSRADSNARSLISIHISEEV